MAYSVLQSSLYSSRSILSSTINSGSKCETLRRVAVDPRSPLGRYISSYCRRQFNLHLLRPANRFFAGVKQSPIWQVLNQLRSSVNDKLLVLSVLFGRQFNAIAAQRIRRAVQIVNLYNNLGYDRRMVRNIVEKIGDAFPRNLGSRPFGLLLGAAFFSWDKERISEDELTKLVLWLLFCLVKYSHYFDQMFMTCVIGNDAPPISPFGQYFVLGPECFRKTSRSSP